jgi:glycosyltransferase involved in cell wall biosynthesis
MRLKRIVQALPVLSSKDAIGEEVRIIDTLLRSWGYQTDIVTLSLDRRRPSSCESWEDTLVLYHHSIGSRLPYSLLEWGAPLILRFHNITPVSFFSAIEEEESTVSACQLGFQQIPMLVRMSQYALPTSFYNATLLQKSGELSFNILPVFRDYTSFIKRDESRPTVTQFLFVGRLSPNKCQHDLLEVLYLYKKNVDPKARLVLVGNGFSKIYFQKLCQLAEGLRLKISFDIHSEDFDVLFAKNISEVDLVKIYHQSSLFLSMSEHEGFCVPLVEAMHARLPILAHNASAVPETLGEAGVLFDKKNPLDLLWNIQRVLTESTLQKSLIAKGIERSQLYNLETTSKQFFKTWQQHT